MKILNSSVTPIKVYGDFKRINFALIAKGKFVYEGYNCNRFLRYLGEEKTYEQVRQTFSHKDIRTHNIDFHPENNSLYIENNNSQYVSIHYANREDFITAMIELIGKKNKHHVNLS